VTAAAIRTVPVHLDAPEQHRVRVIWVLDIGAPPLDAPADAGPAPEVDS
jgi:hypothetical protein